MARNHYLSQLIIKRFAPSVSTFDIKALPSTESLKLSAYELHMRAMKLYLECRTAAEMIIHPLATQELFCWAKVVFDAYVSFWDSHETIAKMLAQQEYCGDIINFKSTSKSFRNKTRVENPKENWAIFKDVHEPIIDRDTWEQVQKLVEKTKRRPPKDKNLKKSIFTSFLYCGDCGHKLWFNFNQKDPSIRFFSCSNYKGMRGTCENTHYIREDALEQIVLMELRMLADFLESAEDDFAELLKQKTNKDMIRERTTAEGALTTAKARSKKLLGLFEKLYEDNVEGKVTDEWFMRLSQKYETEQEELKRQIFELQEKLDKIDQMQTAKEDFLRAIRKFMEMQTLTPILLRELIEKIEVFPVEGKGKDRTQRVIIHYRFVGRLDIPGVIQRPHFILDSRQGVAIEYLPNAI